MISIFILYLLDIECDGSLTLLAEDSSEKIVSWELRPTNLVRRKRKKIKSIKAEVL